MTPGNSVIALGMPSGLEWAIIAGVGVLIFSGALSRVGAAWASGQPAQVQSRDVVGFIATAVFMLFAIAAIVTKTWVFAIIALVALAVLPWVLRRRA